MAYKRYIKRGGKTFGPYYYESYRDEEGRVKTKFISGPEIYAKKSSVTITEKNKEFKADQLNSSETVGPLIVNQSNAWSRKTKLVDYNWNVLIFLFGIFLLIGAVVISFNYLPDEITSVKSDLNKKMSIISNNVLSFITGLTTEESESGESSEYLIDANKESDSEIDSGESGEDSTDSISSEGDSGDVESSDAGAEESSEVKDSKEESASEEESEAVEDAGEEVEETEDVVEESDVVIPEIGEANKTLEENVSINNETLEENETVEEDVIVHNETAVEDNVTNIIEIPESNESIVPNTTLTNETIITNETVSNIIISNYSSNITNGTIRSRIVINKPVKWVKVIKSDEQREVEIPKEAKNIKIKVDEEVAKSLEEIEELDDEIEKADKKDFTDGTITGLVASDLEEEKVGFLTKILNWLGGKKITGDVILESEITGDITETSESKIVNLDNVIEQTQATEVAVEYYTDAPTSHEEATLTGKKIIVSGPENLNYTDILAYTEIDEKFLVGQKDKIKIFWIEEDKKIDFDAFDMNENGKIDYIEWVVPHLSNQTYNIILITEAEHLDSNRTFISDIYDEVKDLDGNWSETIPDEDYVRVVFEKNLTSNNDITVYPRGVSGTPRIEVYEINKTNLIASFNNLNDNEYNKVFLSELIGEQDAFDLRVVGGSLEFDHILDPTQEFFENCSSISDWTVTGGWSVVSDQCKSAVATDQNMTSGNIDLSGETSANLTFYWNVTSADYFKVYLSDDGSTYTKAFNTTGTGAGNGNLALEDSISLTSSVTLRGNCNRGARGTHCIWDNINVTSYVEVIPPVVTINLPENVNYSSDDDIPLNFNVSLNEQGSVRYSLNGGVNNMTMLNTTGGTIGTLFNHTNTSIADGSYTFSAYANDTSGNNNWTENVTFSVGQLYKFNTNIVEEVHAAPLSYNKIVLAWCDETNDDVSFKIEYTNGTDIVSETDVDDDVSTCEGDYGVSVSAFNSTAFVVGWFDLASGHVSFKVYNNSGNNLTGEIDAATSAGNSYSSVSLSAFNESMFVIGWINTQAVTDIGYFAVYRANGTVFTSATQFDSAVCCSSTGNSRVGVSAFNDTTFALAYYDVNSQNITALIYDYAGNLKNGITVDDGVSTDANSVSVSAFNSSAFVVGWFDNADDDASFKILDANNNNLTGIIDADTDVGTSQSVSVSALNKSAFAIGWFDGTDNDATFAVYTANGTNIVSAKDADTTALPYQEIASYAAATKIEICEDNFVFGWVRNNKSAYWNAYYGNNGSSWNGECETVPPQVTINFPTNTTYRYTSLPFNFNVSLNEEGSVKYSLDGGVNNATMFDGVNVIGQYFNRTNGSIADGGYRFSVYAEDRAENKNYSAFIDFSLDQTFPNVTSLTELPADPATYSFGQAYRFNATVTDANLQTVLLDFNSKNYSTTNLTSSVYNATITNLAAGSYNYYWYANDTAGNINSSQSGSYTIDKATPTGSLTNTDAWTVTYPESVTIGLSESNSGDGDVSYLVYRDNVSKGTGETVTLGVGSYSYHLNTTGGQNYSSVASMDAQTLTVNLGTSVLNLTLNGTQGNISLEAGSTILLNGTIINGDSSATLRLYNNGTLINQGTTEVSNSTTFNGIGLYNITAIYNQSENYSSSSQTYWINVTNTTVSISISLSSKLVAQINWTIATIPVLNLSAEGNNGNGTTDYFVNVSVSGGTADLYIRANSDLLTADDDVIGLGNETLSYNTTNSSVPSLNKFSLTTNYSDNKIGSALGDLSVVYLKFFINAPLGTAAGTYNNTLEIKAVQTGQTP